jgi:hypothetical protein
VRDLVVGIKDVMGASHRIGNRDHRVRLAGGLQRTEAGERDFVARASLAIAIEIAGGRAVDRGAVLKGLRGFGRSGRRERSTLHELAAMQAFEAHEFDVVAERTGTAGSTWASVHHDVWSWGRCVLRARAADTKEQRGG